MVEEDPRWRLQRLAALRLAASAIRICELGDAQRGLSTPSKLNAELAQARQAIDDLALLQLGSTSRIADGTETHGQRCPIRQGAGGEISADWCSAVFEPVLRDLSPHATVDTVRKKLTLHSSHHRGKRIDVLFTPFDVVQPSAKVLLIGITPGEHQWRLAVGAARDVVREGGGLNEMLVAASRTGSFAGPMRGNLVSMLDGLGLHRALGIPSTASMFDGQTDLIDSTSAIMHAVFVDGQNYGGHSPRFDRVPILREFVERVLAAYLRMVPDALIVPLGKAVESAVALAAVSGGIDKNRILKGFPHPSGANGGRIRQYEQSKPDLIRQVRTWQRRVLTT
jgi:hypothetical protein